LNDASVGIKVSWMTYKTVFVSTLTKTNSHSDDPSRAGAGAGEMIRSVSLLRGRLFPGVFSVDAVSIACQMGDINVNFYTMHCPNEVRYPPLLRLIQDKKFGKELIINNILQLKVHGVLVGIHSPFESIDANGE
jgi:hypothetical protein